MPIDDHLADLTARPPGSASSSNNRAARAELEESVRRCDAGDLGLFDEPLRAPARRAIDRLDHQLLMLANGFDPYTGQPLGHLDPAASEGR